jgi:uncharacterized protein YjbJ (UPF0337 family)
MTYDNKSSADLEREVNEQRNRVEARIGEIKDKLSPGQLLDEALSYTRHGGAHFASNLGSQISANPLPAALVGVGLAWLISSSASGNGAHVSSRADFSSDDHAYPYARTSGGLKRVSHQADESGQWWSEFETSTGERYKAKATEFGERAGHFTDKAGKMFGGFIDDAGNRVRDFQDEAGKTLHQVRSWADHSWRDMRHGIASGISGVSSAVRDAASSAGSGARHMGGSVQQQSDQLARQVVRLFDEQPLIAGALAFAVGAAVGAALPHTDQEDQLLGEQADKLRGKAAETAGKLYEDGKEKAAELYDAASAQAGELYDEVKDKVADLANGQTTPPSIARH